MGGGENGGTFLSDPALLRVEIPGLRVQSEMNLREHWATVNKRKKRQSQAVMFVLRSLFSALAFKAPQPLRVALTRLIGPRGQQMDTDNLSSAFKFIRDAVADWLGRSDAPGSGVEWVTAQERANDWGVRIEIVTTEGE